MPSRAFVYIQLCANKYCKHNTECTKERRLFTPNEARRFIGAKWGYGRNLNGVFSGVPKR